MTNIIVTLKIMPKSPSSDLGQAQGKIVHLIKEFGGEVGKVEQVPVAFGLESLNIIFVMDENIGSTEELEKQVARHPEVNSVEVIDVRRAIG